MKRWIVMSLTCTALVLGGCAHSKKMQAMDGMGSQMASGSAESYGVGDTAGYQTNALGMRINALRAPANQTYYFDFNSNQVHEMDDQALNIQANYLVLHPKARIRLEGNTDNRGSREYNIGLGWRRAQAVQQFLIQRGVQSGQIQMISYGKEHPAVAEDGEKAWRLNRRVDLIYKVS